MPALREAEAKRLFGRDPGLPPATRRDYLTPWTAARAEKRFLARFKTLTSRRVGKGAFAPCPPCPTVTMVVGTLRFAHPTTTI